MTPFPGNEKQPCKDGFACPYCRSLSSIHGMVPHCTYPYITIGMEYAVKIYLNRKSWDFTEEGHVHTMNWDAIDKLGPIDHCPLMFEKEE